MNTVQLECFLSVAQHLNFSKAAQEINITQPAVSHQISSLEDELGTKLFERTSKNVSITETGIQFIPDAESIMKIFAETKTKMAANNSKKSFKLSIGCHNPLEYNILAMILRPLLEEFPTLNPTIRRIPFRAMENMLDENKIQILFGFSGRECAEGIAFSQIKKCRLALICNESYAPLSTPFNEFEYIPGKIILGEPHKIPAIIYHAQSKILENRRSEDICFGDEFESVLTMVKAGMGFSITTDIPQFFESDMKYIPLNSFPKASIGIYYKKDKGNNVLNRFVEIAQEILCENK